ncbi:MAG: tRNA pseudouridine(55) synthase TruB [Bacteroidales bacterium]|nr:tRNA pseudouridine(55) synthase TruB [Bacteroidales bacterium]
MNIPGKENPFEEGQVLLFNKPLYWTSFDLVNKVRIMIRESTGIKKIKVGHAGTLDPLADGLMILCTGKATRRAEEFTGLDKEYVAEIFLGKTTPSFDLETGTDGEYPVSHITRELAEEALGSFLGRREQVPPVFSAKLIQGKRAYELARKGIDTGIKPVNVVFREIELLDFNLPVIKVRILCSKGTYIRAFARDIGKALGSGAHLSALTRTAIGPYRTESAIDLEKFKFLLNKMKQTGNFSV